MSVFDLDQKGQQAIAEEARLNPLDTSQVKPGAFTGMGTGIGSGVMRGGAKVGQFIGMAGAVVPLAIDKLTEGDNFSGQSLTDSYFEGLDKTVNRAVDHWTPSASEVGKVGHVLGGLSEIVLPLMAGGGNPTLLIGAQEMGTATELVRHGVDADTAAKAGLLQGGATAIGFRLPAAFGSNLAQRLATGAGVNLAVGVPQRAATASLLEAAKRPDLADAYGNSADALAVDFLTGLVFGGISHAAAGKVKPSDADAVLTAANAKHYQADTAPGMPADPAASVAHQSAMDTAIQQLVRGERVNVAEAITEADFIKKPESPIGAAIREAYGIETPKPVSGARGIRNNNPGNIENGAQAWQGQIAGNDSRFATFATPEAGIRALAKNLIAYNDKHGLNTVDGIINRWAPPGENKTSSYVQAVAKELGVKPGDMLDVRNPDTLTRLTSAIIRHENGAQPYPVETMRAGVDAALSWRAQRMRDQNGIVIEQKTNSDFLSAKSNAGLVGGHIREDALHIKSAEVAENMRGRGEGVKLYSALIDHALAAGLKVYSDSTVEAEAVHVYEALRRRGYDVRRLDGGKLEDDAVYGRGATEPAFEIVSGPTADNTRAPDRFSARGMATTAVTERGATVQAQFVAVEADRLVTSHDNSLKPNPAFPRELQPRDRARAASEAQIAKIENGINPELLAESPKASDGAPIIGEDRVVESGNARTIALRRAYESGKADAYRSWLIENAERFGLDPKKLAKMKRPVLARVGLGEYDRAEFARQANESAVAQMSVTETARADAARMPDLMGLVANEDGTISIGSSSNFIRGFMESVVSPSEQGAMITAGGTLSQQGLQRIRNAVFAKAYGDPEIVAMMAESTDANVKNILAGMLRAAPAVARLKDLIDAGARYPMDFTGDMVKAVRQFSQLRADGMTVDQFLAQRSLFDSGLSPEINNLLIGLQENAKAPKRVAEMIGRVVDTVDQLGDPRQSGMFDSLPTPKPHDVIADAVETMRAQADIKPTGDLFSTPEIEAARQATDINPDMRVVLDDGTEVSAREAMARVGDDAAQAEVDAKAFGAAVNCFLRNV